MAKTDKQDDLNFHDEALAFVIKHGCAASCPVALVEEAMTREAVIGATQTAIRATALVASVRDNLAQLHAQSAPHEVQSKMLKAFEEE